MVEAMALNEIYSHIMLSEKKNQNEMYLFWISK